MWRNHARTRRAYDVNLLIEIISSIPFGNSPRALEPFLPEQVSPFLMHRNHQRGNNEISRIHWFCSNGNGELFSGIPLIRKPDANKKRGIVRPSFARQRTCLVRGSRTRHIGFSRTFISEHRRKHSFATSPENENQPSSSPEKTYSQKPVLPASPETVFGFQ